jgi:hypothetical protein
VFNERQGALTHALEYHKHIHNHFRLNLKGQTRDASEAKNKTNKHKINTKSRHTLELP